MRKKNNLAQTQLVEKTGMEKGQKSKIENGKFNLTLATINKLAPALGAKINFDLQLIYGIVIGRERASDNSFNVGNN